MWDALGDRSGGAVDLPLVIAGDIFDIPCPDLVLVNMFYRWMHSLNGNLRVIPGQHDLKNHDIKSLSATGLGMVRSVEMLCPLDTIPLGNGRVAHRYSEFGMEDFGEELALPNKGIVRLWGLGWEQEINCESLEKNSDDVRVMAIHRYVHNGGDTAYEGTAKMQQADQLCELLSPFDFIFCGDNHTPFEYQARRHSPLLVNCGALQCRNVKQRKFIPSVTVLCENRKDGDWTHRVVRINLDVSGIEWANDNVLKLLADHQTAVADFRELAKEIEAGRGPTNLFAMLSAFLKHIGRPEFRDDLLSLLDLPND
jgi:DNA repair exonuclease SbcCD nuclease subunit